MRMRLAIWQKFLKRITDETSSTIKQRNSSRDAYFHPRMQQLEHRIVLSGVGLTSSLTNPVAPPPVAYANANSHSALAAAASATSMTAVSCTETGITVTVQVTGSAPTGTVSIDFYDGTGTTYLFTSAPAPVVSGTAMVTQPLTAGSYFLQANYSGDLNNNPSSSIFKAIDYQVTCTPGGGVGILLLKQCGTAITTTSDGDVKVTGGDIIANTSSATEAKLARSGSVVSDTDFNQSGPYAGGVDGGATMADPYATLAAPAMGVLRSSSTLNISGNTVVTLQPGRYIGGINISGNATVTLAPGIYYLDGGGLTVSGKASLAGDNVLIYNAAKSTSCGVTGGSITFSTSDTVNLTGRYGNAPNDPYDDIAIFQDRRLSNTITLSGSGDVNVVGKIYAPAAEVKVKGDGSLVMTSSDAKHITAQLVVYDLYITGTVTSCSKTSTCFGGKPSNCYSNSTNCYSNYSKNNCYSYSTNCSYNSNYCYSYSTGCHTSAPTNRCSYTTYCSSHSSSKGGCNTGCGTVCTTVPAKGGISVDLGNMGGNCTCTVTFVE